MAKRMTLVGNRPLAKPKFEVVLRRHVDGRELAEPVTIATSQAEFLASASLREVTRGIKRQDMAAAEDKFFGRG